MMAKETLRELEDTITRYQQLHIEWMREKLELNKRITELKAENDLLNSALDGLGRTQEYINRQIAVIRQAGNINIMNELN